MSMHSLRSFRNGFVSREQESRNQHKVAGVNSKPQKNTHLPSKKRLCKMRCDKKHVVCLPQGRILYEPQTTFKQHRYKMNEKEKKNNMLSAGNVTYNYRFGIRRRKKNDTWNTINLNILIESVLGDMFVMSIYCARCLWC